MSTSGGMERRDAAGGLLDALGAAMRRLSAAYILRRLEAAIPRLRAMSDEQLGVIGLSRADVAGWASEAAGQCAPGRQCPERDAGACSLAAARCTATAPPAC